MLKDDKLSLKNKVFEKIVSVQPHGGNHGKASSAQDPYLNPNLKLQLLVDVMSSFLQDRDDEKVHKLFSLGYFTPAELIAIDVLLPFGRNSETEYHVPRSMSDSP